MSAGEQIFGLALLAGLIAIVSKYYWLRVFAGGAILVAWAMVALCAPFYFAADDLSRGRYGSAIATLVVSIVVIVPWFIAAKSAREWVTKEKRIDRWTKLPWNAP